MEWGSKRLSKDSGKFFVIFFLSAAVFFVLFNSSHHVYSWVYLSVNPFIHGISSFKINFFILYSLLICFFVVFEKGAICPLTVGRLKKAVFLGVISAMLIGLGAFLNLASRLRIPIDKYAYYFKDHYVTFNCLTHTHITKLLMYHLAEMFRLSSLKETCDLALPLAGQLHPLWLIGLAFFVLIALVCFIALARSVVLSWEKHKQWFVFILYVFASGQCIKSLIDGGIFSGDLLPSLIAIHILFYAHNLETLSAVFKKNILRYVLFVILFVVAGSALSFQDAILHVPVGISFFLSIYVVFFMLFFRGKKDYLVSSNRKEKVKREARILLFLFCLAYIAFYYNSQAIMDMRALLQRVSPQHRIIQYSYNNKSDFPQVIDCSAAMAGKRFIEVYYQLRDNPFRNRNTAIIGPDDVKAYGFIFAIKILKSAEKVSFPPNAFMRIQVLQDLSSASEKTFLLRVVFNESIFPPLWGSEPTIIEENNRYVALFFLNHYFTNHGIVEYIIFPYYYQIIP